MYRMNWSLVWSMVICCLSNYMWSQYCRTVTVTKKLIVRIMCPFMPTVESGARLRYTHLLRKDLIGVRKKWRKTSIVRKRKWKAILNRTSCCRCQVRYEIGRKNEKNQENYCNIIFSKRIESKFYNILLLLKLFINHSGVFK